MRGRRIRQKLNEMAGFTLAETLLAVLILLLVSSIVAAGIPAAKNAYEKVVLGANAQLLLSTTVSELRDELGTAWDVEIENTGDVLYFSAETGAKSKLYVEGNKIMVQRFSKVNGLDNESGKAVPLVSDAAATRDLYVIYESASYDDSVITFKKLEVHRASNGGVLADLGDGTNGDLTVRVFSTGSDDGE